MFDIPARDLAAMMAFARYDYYHERFQGGDGERYDPPPLPDWSRLPGREELAGVTVIDAGPTEPGVGADGRLQNPPRQATMGQLRARQRMQALAERVARMPAGGSYG